MFLYVACLYDFLLCSKNKIHTIFETVYIFSPRQNTTKYKIKVKNTSNTEYILLDDNRYLAHKSTLNNTNNFLIVFLFEKFPYHCRSINYIEGHILISRYPRTIFKNKNAEKQNCLITYDDFITLL